MKIISIISQKVGVGKTTTSFSLITGLLRKGFRKGLMMITKKNFKDSIANQKDYKGDSEGNNYNSPHRETKSKKVNFLLRPSDVKLAVKIAAMKQISLNELVNVYLSEGIKKDFAMAEHYDEVFGKKS
jgi:cellulose biosynthesis protein BcsQ